MRVTHHIDDDRIVEPDEEIDQLVEQTRTKMLIKVTDQIVAE